MELYDKAILWPANPNRRSEEMPDAEGDAELHSRIADERGAVYWDLKPPRKELKGPFPGYIYVASPISAVKYKCVVEQVISRQRLKNSPEELKFIPDFRLQCLKGYWENGKKHDPSETWIKTRNIEEMKEKDKSKFIKLSDGKPILGSIRSIIYVEPQKQE